MRKLPILTERSIGQMRAVREEIASELTADLPMVSCKSGCSNCCSYPVYISILEGIVLYRHLASKGQWTPKFRKKVEEHSDLTFDLAPTVWLTLNLPCPLLEKNKCLGYAARPFSCRSLYARSPAEFCHPYRMNKANFVERDPFLARFREAETKILGKHKLVSLGMPISKALLLAEKIVQGEADLEHFLAVLAAGVEGTQP